MATGGGAYSGEQQSEPGATGSQAESFLRSLSAVAYSMYPPDKVAQYSQPDAGTPLSLDAAEIPDQTKEHMDVLPALGAAVYALEFSVEVAGEGKLPSAASLTFCKQTSHHYLSLLYSAEVRGTGNGQPVFTRTMDVFTFTPGTPATARQAGPARRPPASQAAPQEELEDMDAALGLKDVTRQEAAGILSLLVRYKGSTK